MSDDILAANTRFYEVFVSGDLVGLVALWAEDDDVAVAHPGWPTLHGYAAVMASWRDIFLAGPPYVICEDPIAHQTGDNGGYVVCYERVGDTVLAATNIFKRVDGHWRMVHHQAGPVAAEALEAEAQAHEEDEWIN
jgi:ketosteroid isomerase-like protein